MGLNDDAWKGLFDRYHILDAVRQEGRFTISASQIKPFREPRLMTKFDHRVNLPSLFAENGLSILPVTRGDYVISTFSAYQDFPPPAGRPKRISIPSHLQSLAPRFLTSEAIALNCAAACGIFQDFLGEDALIPTVSGRMGSGSFTFAIDTAAGRQNLTVEGAQIEIDAAYEGQRSLVILEAKRDLADDFLVRQLYYPYRVWRNRVSKRVTPVFFVFSNGVFTLYQYEFQDPNHYNSLRLARRESYAIAAKISLADTARLLEEIPAGPEPPISFPQANSMARIVNLMELLREQPLTRQDITARYAFDQRQTSYYTDAGRYLGFMEKARRADGAVLFSLSDTGRRVMDLGHRERQLAIMGEILRHRPFREALRLYLNRGEVPDARTVMAIMKASRLYRVGAESTYYRRASTVIRWIEWILGTVEE